MIDTRPKLSHLFSDLTQAEKYLHECQRKVSRFRARFCPDSEWFTGHAKPRLVHSVDLDHLEGLTDAVQDAKEARDATQTRLCREFSKLPSEAIRQHAESPYYLQRRIAKHCLTLSAVTINVPIAILEALEQAGVDSVEIAKHAILKAYKESEYETE